MPAKTAVESPKEEVVMDDRCAHITSDGRRCRNHRISGKSAFCTPHTHQEQQYINADRVAEELLAGVEDFQTTLAVNEALGRLFQLTAQNRIPVRNAAVLAYIGQLLLQSVGDVRHEITCVKGEPGKMEIMRAAINILNESRN